MKKWWGVIVLGIVGVLALVVGIIYLTESIHQLPSFLGGSTALNKAGKPKRGNHHTRGILLIIVCVIAFAFAGYLAWRNTRTGVAAGPGSGATPETTAGQSASGSLEAPPS
jgi:drug/metabolite transporter (DMT)-like permease